MGFRQYSKDQWAKTNKILFSCLVTFGVTVALCTVAFSALAYYSSERDKAATAALMAKFGLAGIAQENNVTPVVHELAESIVGLINTIAVEKDFREVDINDMAAQLRGEINKAIAGAAGDVATIAVYDRAQKTLLGSSNAYMLTIQGRAAIVQQAAMQIELGWASSLHNPHRKVLQ